MIQIGDICDMLLPANDILDVMHIIKEYEDCQEPALRG